MPTFWLSSLLAGQSIVQKSTFEILPISLRQLSRRTKFVPIRRPNSLLCTTVLIARAWRWRFTAKSSKLCVQHCCNVCATSFPSHSQFFTVLLGFEPVSMNDSMLVPVHNWGNHVWNQVAGILFSYLCIEYIYHLSLRQVYSCYDSCT